MNSRRTWSEEEDKLIASLVEEYGTKNWAAIATMLSKRLREKPRSGKQCRQRWHNHLDPSIEKKGWSKAEEEKLFQLHKKHGNKWTVIAEELPGRTDNSIKNYFYSTIRRSLRRMGKFVGSKNSTEQMKKIKPSTLSKIFAAGSELISQQSLKPQQQKLLDYIKDNCESVRDEIIQFTNYKPTRNDKAPEKERSRFQAVIQKMVRINEIYQKVKGQQKKRKYQEEMFQKDYNRLMLSQDDQSENDSPSSELNQVLHEKILSSVKKSSIKTRNEGKRVQLFSHQKAKQSQQLKENQAHTNIKSQTNLNYNLLTPTVIIKSQQNLSEEENGEDIEVENPDFFIQLKEDFMQMPSQHSIFPSLLSRSPGYFCNTPSLNSYNFFQSPTTPKSLEFFCNLNNSNLNNFDQCKNIIQREIESNLSGEDKKTMISITSIGSPGSAFRYFGGGNV